MGTVCGVGVGLAEPGDVADNVKVALVVDRVPESTPDVRDI